MSLRPSGFVEYSPSEQIQFDKLIEIISQTYKSFWYSHIHTPAVESNKVLLSKNWEETGKQIFGLYWLAQGAEDLKDYSLHFDLTVPFARYVLDRESELTFPFKRYQIQPVRRWERAQKGRFREFWQCDIDVIRKKTNQDSEYLYYDAEVIFVLMNTLKNILTDLSIQDDAVMHISNKKLIIGFLETITTGETIWKIGNLIDKFKKVWPSIFTENLKEIWLNDKDIDKILNFITLKLDWNHREALESQADNDLFREWLSELKEVISLLSLLNDTFWSKIQFEIDLQIVRWLDYYTGTVFEAVLKNDENLGSICGGGRYSELTRYIDPKKDFYAWIGGSIGITRLLSKIFESTSTAQTLATTYLFLNFRETFADILTLAGKLQKDWKKIEIFPSDEKLWKQFWYADKKWIPYVVILWEGEKQSWTYKIKDMKTGQEEEFKLN